MRYLSVCSGIEAATVAWHPLGWTPVAFSEIEPFPSAVLAHHYPNVPNYGDMTKFEEWPLEPRTVDLLVGGTPCQSFSVAGLRKGISDPRGGLMLTYLEIARRFRPRWIVWENVPGVLSSNGGRDFGSFLGGLEELGYGWAYRVLDAQYCRVDGRWPKAIPQRRRRVFVVGCDLERNPRGRELAAEVLALGTGLRWHLAESGKTRKGTASDAEGCAATVSSKWSNGSGGYAGTTEHHNLIQVPEVCGTLDTECGSGKLSHQSVANGHLISTSVWWDGSDCAGTLTKQNANGAQRMPDKDNFGAVLQPVGYRWQNDRDGLVEDGTAPSCRASAGSSGFHEMNHPVVVQQPVPYDLFQITAPVNRQNRKPGDPCHTLARDNAAHAAVACPTLTAHNDPSRSPQSSEVTQQVAAVHAASMTVRRLTPRECERLQGFPDDYTAIPWRGKAADQCPDGPRYKALGNSMACNCMAWIGERIAAVDSRHDL